MVKICHRRPGMSASEAGWGYILIAPKFVEEAEPVGGSGMSPVTENCDHGDRRKEVGENV